MTTLSSAVDLLLPTSEREAVDAFGDGAASRSSAAAPSSHLRSARAPAPGRALLLTRAGLAGVSGDGTLVIGAMTPVAALADGRPSRSPPPRAASPTPRSAARPRSAATSARRPAGNDAPRGDLQAPLVALRRAGALGRRGRRAHRAGRGLPGRSPADRLVLVGRVRPSRARGLRAVRPAARPHLHHPRGLGDGRRRTAWTTCGSPSPARGPRAARLRVRRGGPGRRAATARRPGRCSTTSAARRRACVGAGTAPASCPTLVARAVASLA